MTRLTGSRIATVVCLLVTLAYAIWAGVQHGWAWSPRTIKSIAWGFLGVAAIVTVVNAGGRGTPARAAGATAGWILALAIVVAAIDWLPSPERDRWCAAATARCPDGLLAIVLPVLGVAVAIVCAGLAAGLSWIRPRWK